MRQSCGTDVTTSQKEIKFFAQKSCKVNLLRYSYRPEIKQWNNLPLTVRSCSCHSLSCRNFVNTLTQLHRMDCDMQPNVNYIEEAVMDIFVMKEKTQLHSIFDEIQTSVDYTEEAVMDIFVMKEKIP